MSATASSDVEKHLELGKQSLANGQLLDALHHYSKAIGESKMSGVKEKKKVKKDVAEGGFDPPTFGLWAQHAPAAPLC